MVHGRMLMVMVMLMVMDGRRSPGPGRQHEPIVEALELQTSLPTGPPIASLDGPHGCVSY